VILQLIIPQHLTFFMSKVLKNLSFFFLKFLSSIFIYSSFSGSLDELAGGGVLASSFADVFTLVSS